jgi:hypothetical protein
MLWVSGKEEAMLRIELNPTPGNRWQDADFAVHTSPTVAGWLPGDVGTYCTPGNCEQPSMTPTTPVTLKHAIESTLGDGVKAMIGNAGCELTFRHICGCNAKRNIRFILNWANCAYDILGPRLVLAPMDFDVIQDVMSGHRLLSWAARNHVPLVIFCGYRFLFKGDEFEHIAICSRQHSFSHFANPYKYPFREISDAIHDSGAEVWTGAGFAEGLAAGALESAQRFGFNGVLTSKAAWNAYYLTQPGVPQ